MENLIDLNVGHNSITANGLEELATSSIERLTFFGIRLDSTMIESISRIPHLRELRVSQTSVNQDDLGVLKAVRPELAVIVFP